MARLYANENFPRPVVVALRQSGHDVLTSLEAGNAGRSIPDVDVLQYAIAQQRAVITLNRRHFVRLHNEQPQHFGIIVCSYDPDFAALAARTNETLLSHANLRGQLLRVNRPTK
jgi:hypothetical protein